MNTWDVLILLAVALILGLAVLARRRRARRGCGSCCSCCSASCGKRDPAERSPHESAE